MTGNLNKNHYGKYFRDIRHLKKIDIYRFLELFEVTDHALGHAIKKLALAGARTGEKPLVADVTEARDTLNRWLEMLAEDLGNVLEEVEWPDESRIDVIGQNGNDGEAYAETVKLPKLEGVK